MLVALRYERGTPSPGARSRSLAQNLLIATLDSSNSWVARILEVSLAHSARTLGQRVSNCDGPMGTCENTRQPSCLPRFSTCSSGRIPPEQV